ncbi:MAG: hypothetical protein ACOYNY_45110 [Caldilineaceae bacterium]
MTTKFFISLAITVVLVITWAATTVIFGVDHRDYLNFTAPWWHVAIHVAWIASLCVTSMCAASLLLELRSRQRHKLTEQPPQ